MDFALGIIAIFGFVLSIYNFVYEIVKSRKRLKMLFNHVFRFGNPGRCTEVIHISIINNSTKAICITGMTVFCRTQSNRFGEFKKILLTHESYSRNQIKYTKTWTANSFPTKIDPGDVFCGLIASSSIYPVLDPGEPCYVVLKTNRGPDKLKVSFTAFSDAEQLQLCREPDC